MECSIEGCASRVLARGWCAKHYNRWQRHGDPMVTSRTPPIAPDATEKLCIRCGQVKPLDEFGSRGGRVGNRPRGYCWPCEKEYLKERNNGAGNAKRRAVSRKWSNNNKEYFLKRLYGITMADYEAMREAQGDRCAICQTDEVGGNANHWHVDHCHSTGKVRALLCHRCNMFLGYAQDDPVRLRTAAKYLEAHM